MMIVTVKQTPAAVAKFGFALLLTSAALSAQTSHIQARIGNGDGNNGKCTIEVEVDSVAEVEVSGSEARLNTLSGGAATFRRMDCTGALPRNPADFRFKGVDGRGSQQLIRDPRQGGGIAVVRIDDRDGGREGYTFDLIWSNSGSSNNGGFNSSNGGFGDTNGNNGGFNNGRGNNNGQGRGNQGNWNGPRNGDNSANSNQAMRACQTEVASRIRRGGYSDIQFGNVNFDNNRNRADWIVGSARGIQTFGTDQFDFTCRVDLASGRLGDVRVDRINNNGRR
jgi:hypothetical protein